MTPVPVVPAVPISDEQLEAVKGLLNECPLLGHPLNRSTVDALLARLDAAEERADRAENNFDTLVDVNAGLAAERDAALARVLPEGAVSIVGERMAMVRQCTDVAQSGEFCVCPTPDAPTRPAVVLDPFCGTGTTVAVANALGRHGIGIDLSADYLTLARWRCADPKLRAKVLGVDPPAPQVTGQLDLLGGAA